MFSVQQKENTIELLDSDGKVIASATVSAADGRSAEQQTKFILNAYAAVASAANKRLF